MKFKDGVIITKNGDEHIIVAAGEAGQIFSGMIKMNSTAAFIAELLCTEMTEEMLIEKFLEKYDVTYEKAQLAVLSVLEKFKSAGLMSESAFYQSMRLYK